MNFSNTLTDRINKLETFATNGPLYFLPFRVIAFAVIILLLICSNFIALIRWPFSASKKLFAKASESHGAIINVSSVDQFDTIIASNSRVLVDFWAEWCGPCLLMNKTVEVTAEKYAGSLTVVKVDASLGSAISKKYNVRGLPTMILFEDGQEQARKSGSLTIQQIESEFITNKC
ncbi:thioredoxin family protein [Veronia nyctiphanis]|uniref:thioredoxin family protein n=1 Tax=Veronia nyctiphanis TaxID=1278244 RepID=UPI0013756184|nr:thioredoxin family protein [Veronia nyctiphanis]